MTLRDFARPRLWLGIWVFGWMLCIALSLLPPIELGAPRDSDKIGHFLAYAVLASWAVMIFRTRRSQALAALSLLALGIAIEFAQALFTSTRQGDLRDAVADALGIGLGLAIATTPLAGLLQWLDRKLFR